MWTYQWILITARFQTRFVKVTIIQCYVPTVTIVQCYVPTVTIIQCYVPTVTIIQCYAPTVTIIQCYAPTNDHDDKGKDKFYNQLQSLINKTPSHYLLLVMGDFNANIGNVNIDVREP